MRTVFIQAAIFVVRRGGGDRRTLEVSEMTGDEGGIGLDVFVKREIRGLAFGRCCALVPFKPSSSDRE